MGNESPTPHELLTEAVVFWSIAVVTYVGRMVSRTIANGSIKRLNFDDYIMTATFLIYTSLLILINISCRYGTNLMDPADYHTVLEDPQQVEDRIFGSKLVIGLEQCMLFSTWGVKICMLALFWRLTKNLRLHIYVKMIAVYVAVGFVVIMVTYYAVYCRPFSQYWAIVPDNMQCATYQNYSITQAVFNISSDAAMLVVPIPLMIKTQLRAGKKVLLVCIMSLGIFTVVAAILNKVYNFASPLTTTYQIWYIREASTSIYVANLICLWPLLRKIFGLKAFQTTSRQYRHQVNEANKDFSGASQSAEISANASQSRPSLSIHQTLYLSKLGCRNAKTMLPTRKVNEPHASQEAINKGSIESLAEAHELREIPMERWSKEDEPTPEGKCTSPDLESGTMAATNRHQPSLEARPT